MKISGKNFLFHHIYYKPTQHETDWNSAYCQISSVFAMI